jgi:phage tail sheath gpL-like
MIAPSTGNEFDGAEREQLLLEGITTYTIDSAGACYVERIVTTHQEDQFGNPTSVYRDRQVLGLLFAIRYDWRTFLAGKYPRHMHAADGVVYAPGLPIVQPSTIRAEFAGRARNVWSTGQGWIEAPDQFEADIVIERVEDGFDMVGVPDLINRFHVSRTRFDFLR